MSEPPRASDRVVRFAWIALLAVVLTIVIAARVRLLDLPLERDEGEYAYAGQLLLQGIPPYQLAYNMKFPGTYVSYALLMSVFGQTIASVHLGLLLVNAATVALVFLLGRKLLNAVAGMAAAGTYAVLSVSPSVLGFAGHATHFVVLPALGGALLLLRSALPLSAIAASGTLFGIAVLMKQPALFLGAFATAFLLYRDWRAGLPLVARLRRAAVFLGSASLPLAVTSLLLWKAGVFGNFWFWTVLYAREYGTLTSLSEGAALLLRTIRDLLAAGWPVWMLAGLGVIACFWSKTVPARTRAFLLALLGCSALSTCPGLYFRQHYFILMLPAVCLLAGVAAATASSFLAHRGTLMAVLPVATVAAGCAWPLALDRNFFLAADAASASRMIYGTNPFPESVRIADYLQAHSGPSDTIAVLGSEPQIYFYARRHSATGYIYTYGLMEPHGYAERMQREMIAEIEAAQPKFLVVVRVNTSWLARQDAPNLIFDWFGQYGLANYRIAGLANISADGRTDYHFPVDLRQVELSPTYLLVYERLL